MAGKTLKGLKTDYAKAKERYWKLQRATHKAESAYTKAWHAYRNAKAAREVSGGN